MHTHPGGVCPGGKSCLHRNDKCSHWPWQGRVSGTVCVCGGYCESVQAWYVCIYLLWRTVGAWAYQQHTKIQMESKRLSLRQAPGVLPCLPAPRVISCSFVCLQAVGAPYTVTLLTTWVVESWFACLFLAWWFFCVWCFLVFLTYIGVSLKIAFTTAFITLLSK